MPFRPARVVALTTALLLTAAGAASADSTGAVPSSQGVLSRALSAVSPGLGTTAQTATQTAAFTTSEQAARPRPVLPERVRGREAVRALGTNLPEVAADNGLTAPALEDLLTEDETTWVSRHGTVYFEEDLPAEATLAEDDPVAATASAPTEETFTLHSRPGAARTIFLDFDGATVTRTGWSDIINNGTHIGWDSDGSPATFSSTEHAWIQEVWRQVSEIYSPFDVDVTTADPGSAALRRSTNADTAYGTQVLITGSDSAVAQACASQCLGVAWIGTFDTVDPTGLNQPAWVFANDKTYSPTVIAQAAAHEVGHTLGLQHDGKGTAGYYEGTRSWGPIMGSSRTRALSQFSKGEYAGANNREDDFAVMRANGLSRRADDHGNSTATARALGAHTAYTVPGIVSSRTDTDVFALDHPCETDLEVSATGIGAQTTLDLSLEVLDADGVRLGVSSPVSGYRTSPVVSTGMDASLTVPAAPGTYYVRVDGVGNGDPAGAGWSDYGSLGQYLLTSTGCADTAPPMPRSAFMQPLPVSDGPPAPPPAPAVTKPGRPRIGTASSGRRGGSVTAVARWSAPTTNGGAAITKYRVVAQRLDSRNRVIRNYYSGYRSASTRALTMRLPRGRFVFKVKAWNRVGVSVWSSASHGVHAR